MRFQEAIEYNVPEEKIAAQRRRFVIEGDKKTITIGQSSACKSGIFTEFFNGVSMWRLSSPGREFQRAVTFKNGTSYEDIKNDLVERLALIEAERLLPQEEKNRLLKQALLDRAARLG